MLKKAFNTVFGNFQMKLLALVISLGIWFYANSRVTQEIRVSAPLTVIPPEGHALLYQSEKTVRMRVVGPRPLVTTLGSDLIRNELTMTRRLNEGELEDGWATLEIAPEWLQPRLREGEFVQLKFRDMKPNTIQVASSPIKERVLPVKVLTKGELPPGHRFQKAPSALPSEVRVEGPAVALNALESIPTEPLSIWYLRTYLHQDRSLQNEVEVELKDGQKVVVPLKLSPSSVIASVYVTGSQQERTFRDLPIRLLAPPGFPYVVEILGPDTATVTVQATAEVSDGLDPASVITYLDVSSLAAEKIPQGGSAPYQERIQVLLPREVIVDSVRVTPERINLQLKNPAD